MLEMCILCEKFVQPEWGRFSSPFLLNMTPKYVENGGKKNLTDGNTISERFANYSVHVHVHVHVVGVSVCLSSTVLYALRI